MVAVETTALTEREVTVLRLRADGHAYEAIAETLDGTDTTDPTDDADRSDDAGTTGDADLTGADVREIERGAEAAIERARRTLDLAATVRRGPVTFTAASGTTVEDLAREVYDRGDDAAIDVAYCHADLQAHLRDALADRIEADRLDAPATLTITEDGDVTTGDPEGGEPDRATVADRD